MISFIKGFLEHVDSNHIILETGGIGYTINVSPVTISKLPQVGEEVKIYTFMNVKEDGISLFGFITSAELKMFNLLISVSGVGPRIALGILSIIGPSEIMLAIVSDDVTALSKAPGVGKKTAQRMILELKDKIKTSDTIDGRDMGFTASPQIAANEKQEAVEALTVLGYSRSESLKAVMEVASEDMTTEGIIKLALKSLSRKS